LRDSKRAHIRALTLSGGRLIVSAAVAANSNGPPFVEFESREVRPLAESPDGTKLFSPNTPNVTLAFFDLTAGFPAVGFRFQSVHVLLTPGFQTDCFSARVSPRGPAATPGQELPYTAATPVLASGSHSLTTPRRLRQLPI
jgi:hypothetical protein